MLADVVGALVAGHLGQPNRAINGLGDKPRPVRARDRVGTLVHAQYQETYQVLRKGGGDQGGGIGEW